MDTATFAQLTYRGQVGRLRELGRAALPRFGLSAGAPLELLNHGENTVFRTRDRRGRAYALRIHRTGYQSPTNIRSEIAWLRALGHEAGIRVPAPVVGVDGEEVQRLTSDHVPGTRSCVLFRWVPGRFCGGSQGAAYYRRLGELAGRVHAHGRAWKRPAGFRRRAWTDAVLLGEAPGFGDPLSTPGVTKRDRVLFKRAMERAR